MYGHGCRWYANKKGGFKGHCTKPLVQLCNSPYTLTFACSSSTLWSLLYFCDFIKVRLHPHSKFVSRPNPLCLICNVGLLLEMLGFLLGLCFVGWLISLFGVPCTLLSYLWLYLRISSLFARSFCWAWSCILRIWWCFDPSWGFWAVYGFLGLSTTKHPMKEAVLLPMLISPRSGLSMVIHSFIRPYFDPYIDYWGPILSYYLISASYFSLSLISLIIFAGLWLPCASELPMPPPLPRLAPFDTEIPG